MYIKSLINKAQEWVRVFQRGRWKMAEHGEWDRKGATLSDTTHE